MNGMADRTDDRKVAQGYVSTAEALGVADGTGGLLTAMLKKLLAKTKRAPEPIRRVLWGDRAAR